MSIIAVRLSRQAKWMPTYLYCTFAKQPNRRRGRLLECKDCSFVACILERFCVEANPRIAQRAIPIG